MNDASIPKPMAQLERVDAGGFDGGGFDGGGIDGGGIDGGPSRPGLAFLRIGDRDLRVNDRVRIRPRAGGDVMDLALAGRTARIESIERDFEDRVHIAVTVDDDPGRDLGLDRWPGHRFFFAPDELETLPS